VIDELPPAAPRCAPWSCRRSRDEVVARIEAACRAGRQAYWVCPLIEESESARHQAAEETARRSPRPAGRAHRPRHGRMRRAQGRGDGAFKAGELDLLVATTVIEVGVDVPNASLMVIENAERMGCRSCTSCAPVGRGPVESTCVLLYAPPLTPVARERLACCATRRRFEVARRDLELRAGELLAPPDGPDQLKVADLVRDSTCCRASSARGFDAAAAANIAACCAAGGKRALRRSDGLTEPCATHRRRPGITRRGRPRLRNTRA